jgi:hypothetical protein
MTSRSRKLKRAVGLLCLTGVVVVLGLTAGAGLAQGGPSPEQLAAQGWTCVHPPVPGIGTSCFNPGEGRPPIPPVEDGRPSYTIWLWTPAGDFLGHSHLIRADLYAGQPCAGTGEPYVLNPRLLYYECIRTV